MILVCMLAPTVSQAALVWSNCEKITAVSDYLAYASYDAIYITVSPAISGCTGNGPASAVTFAVNQEGVTATNVNSILAIALAAYTSGHQVRVFYDNATTPQCYSQIVGVGGYYGECP